jgi:DNA-binding transcriptional ArsR family regulator
VLNKQDALDAMFQALSDPTRRAIVERLSKKPLPVSELAKPFAMSLPAVMQHLAVLEESGLVKSRKEGRVRTCQIEPKGLHLVERWVNERRGAWEKRLDRLGDMLAED